MSMYISSGIRTFEEGKHGDNASWRNVDGELVLPNGKLLDIFRETSH